MLKRQLARILPKYRKSRVLRRIDRMCVGFHEAYENYNYDFHANGESFVLEKIASQLRVGTVLDVGANVGDWTTMAAGKLPGATIHAFEIVPETFEAMRARCAGSPTVRAYPFGLSDVPGEVVVYCAKDLSAVATCVPDITRMFLKVEPGTVKSRVTTGDLFCAEIGVDRIDFLKLDVEGFEPQVLRGFRGKLEAGDIRVIQFEYGYVNVLVKFLLKDFYDLLTPYGMKIGKIFPEHVEFRDYDLREENFLGPNYLAVHASETELLRDLAS
jgi:FkbM family methyltransferase